MKYKVISPCKLHGQYRNVGEIVEPLGEAERLMRAGCLVHIIEKPSVPVAEVETEKPKKRSRRRKS